MAQTGANDGSDVGLVTAYKNLYDAQNSMPPSLEIRKYQQELQDALVKHGAANLEKNKEIAKKLSDGSKREKVGWILRMIEDVEGQIKLLNKGLESFYGASSASSAITEVIKTEVKSPGQDQGQELVATHYADSDSQYADSSKWPESWYGIMLNESRIWYSAKWSGSSAARKRGA